MTAQTSVGDTRVNSSNAGVFRPATAGADLYRVSVYGPGGRVDLSVPAIANIGRLIPLLVRHVGGDDTPPDRSWVVQRIGDRPLDLDGTAESVDLRDGDVLYLRSVEHTIPPVHYDDLADGVAEVIRDRRDRWGAESSRRLFVGLTAIGEVALAVAVLFGGVKGGLATLYAGVAAVLLAAAAVLTERLLGLRALGLVLGLGSVGFAVTVGLMFARSAARVLATGSTNVLYAALCALIVAVVLAASTRLKTSARDGVTDVASEGPLTVYGSVALTAVAVLVSAGLSASYGLPATSAITVVAIIMFLIGAFGPRIASRLARLRVPPLPRTADELQQNIGAEPGDQLAKRAALANAYLSMLVVSGAVVFVVAALCLATTQGWLGWVLPGVFAIAVLLRSRSLGAVWQRGALALAGSVAVAWLLVRVAVAAAPAERVWGPLLVLAGIAVTAVSAWRAPTTRLLPVWGQAADVAELWTAIALIPLVLQLLHVYAFFRSLAG